MATDEANIVDVLTVVLREELKLPADAALDADTKLMGGEHDLDSLDILMLVTAMEKRFQISIPNESIGPDTFEDVGSLARFVRGRLEDAEA